MGTGVGEAVYYAVAAAAASAAVSTILAPKIPNPRDVIAAPEVKPILEQPDPLAQKDAMRKKLAEQMQRSGRASTIMTNGDGKLGG